MEDKWAGDYEVQYPYGATYVDSAGISGKVYCLTRGGLETSLLSTGTRSESEVEFRAVSRTHIRSN